MNRFEYEYLRHKDFTKLMHCAVRGEAAIPFPEQRLAIEAIEFFNAGTMDPDGFFQWERKDCVSVYQEVAA